MEVLWQELTYGLQDTGQLARAAIRLAAAGLLGALVGLQRERAGKPAGLRTHVLVCMGTAVFILAGFSAGISADAAMRIVQGIAIGIGFIGGGTILKLESRQEIQGLTTAAGIWMTAGIGVAVGMGALGLAVLGAATTWVILEVAGRLDDAIERRRASESQH